MWAGHNGHWDYAGYLCLGSTEAGPGTRIQMQVTYLAGIPGRARMQGTKTEEGGREASQGGAPIVGLGGLIPQSTSGARAGYPSGVLSQSEMAAPGEGALACRKRLSADTWQRAGTEEKTKDSRPKGREVDEADRACGGPPHAQPVTD